MANGTPLSGGERKKENETYKERERGKDGGGVRRIETPDFPPDNEVFG